MAFCAKYKDESFQFDEKLEDRLALDAMFFRLMSLLLFFFLSFFFMREIGSRRSAGTSKRVESIGRNDRVPAFLMDHYRSVSVMASKVSYSNESYGRANCK